VYGRWLQTQGSLEVPTRCWFAFYAFPMHKEFWGQRLNVKQNCNATGCTLKILSKPDLLPWSGNTKLWFVCSTYIACWDREFESHRGHGCLFIV